MPQALHTTSFHSLQGPPPSQLSISNEFGLPGFASPSGYPRPVLEIPQFHLLCLAGVLCQPDSPSLPASPGHSETEGEAQKIVGLVVEEIVDDAVTPSLRVAGIRGRQTRRPQNEVVQGAKRWQPHLRHPASRCSWTSSKSGGTTTPITLPNTSEDTGKWSRPGSRFLNLGGCACAAAHVTRKCL